MAVKINQYAYPYIEQVKHLPIYLTGIGGTEYQNAFERTNGYLWHQIFYCASGSGVIWYDDVKVTISAGCFVFVPAYYPHGYAPCGEKWDMRWVVFDGHACNSMLKDFGMHKPLVVRSLENSSMLKLYDKMFVALKTDKICGNYTCAGLVYQYLLGFRSIMISGQLQNGTEKSGILMPALNYIDENYKNDLPVSTLADISGVSQQYLCRIFKQTMNLRPSEYIVYRRLMEAKRLLTETELAVSDIAGQSGFSDTGYFCTVFRKYESITPTEYRRLYKS